MKIINHCLKYLSLIILILLNTYNCKDSGKQIIESGFPTTIIINNRDLDSIKISPVLLHERRIVVTDNYLISMNIESDTICRVFRLADFKYLGGFGVRGRGPTEFMQPNIGGFRPGTEGVILTDYNSVKLVKFNSTKEINNQNVIFERSIRIPVELIPLNQAFILNDSIVCGANREIMELACFNCNDNEVGFIFPLPNLYTEASSAIKSLLFTSQIAISPDKSSIACLYLSFPLLRIYDVNTKNIIETNVKEGPAQIRFTYDDRGITNAIDSYGYYSSIAVTNKYIYGDFQAHKRERTDRGIERIPLTNKQIHVFDWDGEPRLKIELEENWFNVFTASLDDNYLYFIHPFKENFIYRYKLPEEI